MRLKQRLEAEVQEGIRAFVARIGEHTPRRDLRPSIVAPTPEQAEEVLRRFRYEQRLGQPDIHTA